MVWPRTSAMPERVPVRKTYKLFIGGEFPRSESGRSYPVEGAWLARASRKDVRDAVRAGRGALDGWSGRTAYNRAQVLYRVAEIMEGRRQQFVDEGAPWDEVEAAGPFFDFTIPEPVGVVGVAAPEEPALLGLVSRLAPVLAGGNVAVVLASEASPRSAVTLAEVLATSDVPAGVVAVLTGYKAELLPWLAAHRDIDAIDLTGAPVALLGALEEAAADNVKRVVRAEDPLAESPYDVAAFLEMKTVWHPIGP